MIRKFVFAAAAAAVLAAAPAMAADAAIGDWLTVGGKAKVRIQPCGEQLCGAITWLREPTGPNGQPKHDENNKDAKLKGRPIIGMAMLSGFKSAGPGKWTGGKIYDPESGNTYNSKLTVNPNGTLKVEGCIAVICKAQTWTRAS